MSDLSGVSVIVPFYNEQDTLGNFCNTIDQYVSDLQFPVEIVFVNDGSQDDSVDILKEYIFTNVISAKLISLSKNFGSHAAIRAGIQNSSYDICTWIGADLQEPLEIIKVAYDRIGSGQVEAVYFSKKTIKVSFLNRFFSIIYSFLMKKFAVKTYSPEGTATIAFGGKIKKLLNENIEGNSQIILQIMDMGFEYEAISLDYNARSAGKSKWSLSMKIKTFIDSFIAFSYMPIRTVSMLGIFIFFIGMIIGIVTIVNKFINPNVQIGYSTIASVVSLGFGVTNVSIGIIAEYLWRTLDAARNRPVFIVSEREELMNKKGL